MGKSRSLHRAVLISEKIIPMLICGIYVLNTVLSYCGIDWEGFSYIVQFLFIGFIYLVSSLGVTGTRTEINTDLESIVKVIRENTSVPCAIGFGISTPEQAKKMASLSDGAIVGSAIIKIMEQYGKESPSHVGEYVKMMADAI